MVCELWRACKLLGFFSIDPDTGVLLSFPIILCIGWVGMPEFQVFFLSGLFNWCKKLLQVYLFRGLFILTKQGCPSMKEALCTNLMVCSFVFLHYIFLSRLELL